ncbi:hypothetical protein TruAng_002393 [Truncatella angustata]|nr:hypothetical protein TruAng_002393 [Truncatella angustata]
MDKRDTVDLLNMDKYGHLAWSTTPDLLLSSDPLSQPLLPNRSYTSGSEGPIQQKNWAFPSMPCVPPFPFPYPQTAPVNGAPADEPLLYPNGRGPPSGKMPVVTRTPRGRKAKGKATIPKVVETEAWQQAEMVSIKEEEPKKRRNPRKIDYQNWYGFPPKQPAPWGWRTPRGTHTFEYDHLGQLYQKKFSRSELEAYFYAQPTRKWTTDVWVPRQLLPGEKQVLCPGDQGIPATRRHGLTLWIGWTPAASKDRFPGEKSNQCCLRECSANSWAFRAGQPRVALDERMNIDGSSRDPLHVAGYIHLFCLEKHFDILKLMRDLDVRLDLREFDHENINPFSLRNRKSYKACIEGIHQWVDTEWDRHSDWELYLSQLRKDCQKEKTSLTWDQTARPRHFDDSLTKTMVETDKNNYALSGNNTREERAKVAGLCGRAEPCQAGVHLGNLEYFWEVFNSRKRKGPLSERLPSEQQTEPTNENQFPHVVYNPDNFTKGFMPRRTGKSNLDHLGRLRDSPQYLPRPCPNNILLTYEYRSEMMYLLQQRHAPKVHQMDYRAVHPMAQGEVLQNAVSDPQLQYTYGPDAHNIFTAPNALGLMAPYMSTDNLGVGFAVNPPAVSAPMPSRAQVQKRGFEDIDQGLAPDMTTTQPAVKRKRMTAELSSTAVLYPRTKSNGQLQDVYNMTRPIPLLADLPHVFQSGFTQRGGVNSMMTSQENTVTSRKRSIEDVYLGDPTYEETYTLESHDGQNPPHKRARLDLSETGGSMQVKNDNTMAQEALPNSPGQHHDAKSDIVAEEYISVNIQNNDFSFDEFLSFNAPLDGHFNLDDLLNSGPELYSLNDMAAEQALFDEQEQLFQHENENLDS